MLDPKFRQKIHDRFLKSAQEILCDGEAAVIAADNAVQRFGEVYHNRRGKPPRTHTLLQWAQEILDLEIDAYFHGMVDQIQKQEKKIERKFLNMSETKLKRNIQTKINYDFVHWDKSDIEDVVSEAVHIVSNKCMETEFKGLFIQWAQTILNNKYRERRRQKIRKMLRERKIEDESYERKYDQRISDVIEKRRKTEVDPEEACERREDYPCDDSVDPFEGDVHYFEPDTLVEGMDLKEQLLGLVKRIKRKACAQVFHVLFSEGDRKFMAEQFPNRTKAQIDLLVSQCRRQLKQEALKAGIL